MPYATEEDITLAAGGTKKFVELFDWDDDGTADANVLAAAQAWADAEIDGYLRNRYEPLPVAAPSVQLRQLAADEVVYWVKARLGELADTDIVNQNHKDRIAVLEQMRAGTIRPDSPGTMPSTAGRSAIVETGEGNGRGKWEGNW